MIGGLGRLVHIARVLLGYRLDELVEAIHLFRPLRYLRAVVAPKRPGVDTMSRGERLRRALEELGPIFVKAGQVLSTRRDLLPPDIVDALALLRDQVTPYDGEVAEAAVIRALGGRIGDHFASFDRTPLASASIAQVHPATLPDGRQVVVKVLRPSIAADIDRDLAMLNTLGDLAERYLPDAKRIQPKAVVGEIERTLRDELDLMREGANCSSFRRNFKDSPDLYVPEVIWSHSADGVLTMERVSGLHSDDIAALDAAGIDRKRLAAKGVVVFYTQVFRDNFFHADAHAGNIWVDPERREDPRFIALDFGIMGSLPPTDQYYLAENFQAMFTLDYRRIAELHIEAGWIPSHVRVDDLESAVRSVCEPYFTRPLSEISLGEVLAKLFRVAHRYELNIQPQLILLQKTLLNIEGLARQLDPALDIFATAKPVLEAILRKRYSLGALIEDFQRRTPELFQRAPDVPRLLMGYLSQANRGEQSFQMRSVEIAELTRSAERGAQRTVMAVLGAGFLVAGAILLLFDSSSAQVMHLPLSGVAAVVGAAAAFSRALWPR